MKNLLTSTTAILASAALFAAGLMLQSETPMHSNAPATLPVSIEQKLASGPTSPPGPWDDDDTGSGGTKIASGPTIPPGPWDDDDSSSGSTKIASVPTIAPDLGDGIAASVSRS
jgi:hypothetical protein